MKMNTLILSAVFALVGATAMAQGNEGKAVDATATKTEAPKMEKKGHKSAKAAKKGAKVEDKKEEAAPKQ